MEGQAEGQGEGRQPDGAHIGPAAADVVKLLDAAWTSGQWNLAARLELEVHTELRGSELLALRWSTFDADRRALLVDAAIVVGPQGLVEKPVTKTSTIRA